MSSDNAPERIVMGLSCTRAEDTGREFWSIQYVGAVPDVRAEESTNPNYQEAEYIRAPAIPEELVERLRNAKAQAQETRDMFCMQDVRPGEHDPELCRCDTLELLSDLLAWYEGG